MIEMDQKANISTLFKSFLSIWSVQFWRNPSSAARFPPGFFSSFLSQRGLKPGLLQSRRRTLSNAMLDLKIQWKMHFLYRGKKRLFFWLEREEASSRPVGPLGCTTPRLVEPNFFTLTPFSGPNELKFVKLSTPPVPLGWGRRQTVFGVTSDLQI